MKHACIFLFLLASFLPLLTYAQSHSENNDYQSYMKDLEEEGVLRYTAKNISD